MDLLGEIRCTPARPPRGSVRPCAAGRVDTADRQVVIGDGAPWIWNLAAEQFPGAIEIVDIYHAKQQLCDMAKQPVEEVCSLSPAVQAAWR